MAVAVAEKDRSFFIGRTDRAQLFLKSWGLGTNEIAIETYPMCFDAVTDYLIVGLCQISSPGTICEPSTFIPKFEKNLEQCRSVPGANPSFNETPSGAR